MRGPFDDRLKWPFQGEITMKIMNQVGDHNHCKRTLSYSNAPDTAAGRVTFGERSGVWGFTTFIYYIHSAMMLQIRLST